MATTLTLHVATRDINPRGAKALGEFAALVFGAVGRSFRRAAERRAALRAAQEMRWVARSFEASQPNLAADLRAAAMRCEGMLDERR
ncbi:hypothetical protein [Caldimonas tepidiphila]|uniref:hypothetical protein n=1 Tax=Caldimonas tepidiphila TaxID=2315841 RepID=UPI000E5A2F60|nr:hypothetical protein [Caldimonas tepidiphila]